MLDDETATAAYRRINDSYTVNDATFYRGNFFAPDDHGTAQTSVIAPNGDAVSVTSTINFRCVCTDMSKKSKVRLRDPVL